MNQKIKSEETQRLLLESAFSLFHKNGYAATSIPAIVKEACLSKGAFYHHFKSKKEIGEQTVAYILRDRLYHNMIAPLDNNENEETISLLISIFSNRIDGFSDEESQMGCPLNNLINELGTTTSGFQVGLRDIIEEWKTALVGLIEKGKLRNEIREDVDAMATAVYLISAYEGARGIAKLYNSKIMLQQYLCGVIAYLKQLN